MIKDLINSVNNISIILQYFVPGYCFIFILQLLTYKKIETKLILLFSCIISYISIIFLTTINDFIKLNYLQNIAPKICLAIIICSIFSIAVSKIWISNTWNRFLIKHFNRTTHDTVWKDIIDFKNGSNLKVYLKDKDYYIIGHYKLSEMDTNNPWFVLSAYGKYNIKENKPINKVYHNDSDVYITFRLSDVDYMEIF